jgi:hypothetical protein
MINWFAANNLVLTLDKMNVIKLISKNSSHSTLCIGYKEKYTEDTVNTKFLGLPIDNHINWKNHIEQMIPKLSGARYAIRSMVRISNIYTHINLLYVLPFCYKIWNNFLGYLFQQWEDFHFTKEIHQNYGWGTTQNLLWKSV